MGKRFAPLESNPDVLTDYAASLGADVSEYRFTDVYGLDDELLAMVPQPVLAVLLLYPITEKLEKLPLPPESVVPPSSLYFTRQTIGNACGTIAVLHALLNNRDRVALAPGSFLARFGAETAALSPAERARYLENPPEAGPDLEASHAAAAAEGDTPAADPETRTDLHFVALVRAGGRIWELDGRKERPVDRGASAGEERFLNDVANIVRETFLPNADSIEFNLIALAKAE